MNITPQSERPWTFARRLGAGFATLLGLMLMLALVAVSSLRTVASAADHLSVDTQHLLQIKDLRLLAETRASASRAYLLTKDASFLETVREERQRFQESLRALASSPLPAAEKEMTDRVAVDERQYRESMDAAMKRSTADATSVWEMAVMPHFQKFVAALTALEAAQSQEADSARAEAAREARRATVLLVIIAAVVVAAGVTIAVLLTRSLTRQIASAISHLQTSATELQAAASQQAATAKEQSTATNEVTSTVKELLASSRQIAENTQRVVRIAEQTGSSAQSGGATLRRSQEGIASVKRQVDAIVGHMLELGRRSQQIGGVLEIINELAEQTNILAINATIEAAGAGDSGRRFAVVADEIRKLADRVGLSTREIRVLVEEIRSSANTTVMATEQGSKAADAGALQFEEMTANFRQILDLVVTTTESAREIELSTRQQATAVEQVSNAILDVSHAAGEVEVGSRQTVQVAGQLAALSRSLASLVRAGGGEA